MGWCRRSMELSGGECGWRSLSIASGGRVLVRLYFETSGKVVESVNAFEQQAAGNRAGREHRGRGVSRFREENTVNPEASKVGGGG
jgi:hypothetical protein